MRNFFLSLLIFIFPAFLVSGCDDPAPDPDKNPVIPGYAELLDAYKADKLFASAEHKGNTCVITFEDGFFVPVPETSFKVYDCRESKPAEVKVVSGWWSVGDVICPVRVDSSVPDEKASPVYVYFDSYTLHVYQAKEFRHAAELSGLILTKLDGTAKGGIVLSIKKELNIPVKFIGVGEKIDDMEPFDADEFVSALFSL